MHSLYRGHRFPPEIISHAVWLYHRFTLSFHDVDDLFAERGVTVSYEAICLWCRKFVPALACNLRLQQGQPGEVWHVDEVFLKIHGEHRYLQRAAGRNGNFLDILVTRRPDARAAKRFFRKLLKGQGESPWQLLTDKPGSYAVARRELGVLAVHQTEHYENNRAEVPHQHTREQERQEQHLKSESQVQTLLAGHFAIHNAFRIRRHRLKAIYHRLRRGAAFNTWRLTSCLS